MSLSIIEVMVHLFCGSIHQTIKQGYSDRCKLNDFLLRHILNGGPSRFAAFCDALNEVGQNFLVSRLLRPGPDAMDAAPADVESVETPDKRDEMILNVHSQYLLRRNWNELLQNIDSDIEFLSYLRQRSVFTEMQLMKLEVCLFFSHYILFYG